VSEAEPEHAEVRPLLLEPDGAEADVAVMVEL
jgi:hypothetical protein